MKLPGEPQSIYLGWLVVLSIEILRKEHLTSFQPQGNLERGIKRISQVTKKENTKEISNLNNKLIMHINIQPKDRGSCNERDTLCLTHILNFLVRHRKYIHKGSSIALINERDTLCLFLVLFTKLPIMILNMCSEP